MCGIYFSTSRKDFAHVESKLNIIESRGPDNADYLEDDAYVIGHRRLAILDVSSLGHQPFSCSRYILSFNGEIYNYQELRLKYLPNHNIVSNSDTEVLFVLLKELGSSILKELDGMFAFVFLDKDTGDILAARDRFGQKPLVYMYSELGIEIASTVDQIAVNKRLTLNKSACLDVIFSKRVRGCKTVYNEVLKVAPGSLIDGNLFTNELEVKSWYSLEIKKSNNNQIKEFLKAAVKKRLLSDVPIGSFLSGGVDSSLISALAYEESESIKGLELALRTSCMTNHDTSKKFQIRLEWKRILSIYQAVIMTIHQ